MAVPVGIWWAGRHKIADMRSINPATGALVAEFAEHSAADVVAVVGIKEFVNIKTVVVA